MPRDDGQVLVEFLEPDLAPPSERKLPAPELVMVILAGPHEAAVRFWHFGDELSAERETGSDLLREECLTDTARAD
jgi:hypothetical protein